MLALPVEVSVRMPLVRFHAWYAKKESISFWALNIFLLKLLLSKYCLLVIAGII